MAATMDGVVLEEEAEGVVVLASEGTVSAPADANTSDAVRGRAVISCVEAEVEGVDLRDTSMQSSSLPGVSVDFSCIQRGEIEQ